MKWIKKQLSTTPTLNEAHCRKVLYHDQPADHNWCKNV